MNKSPEFISPAEDDWGDFESVIASLEEHESQADTPEAPPINEEGANEAMEGILTLLFALTEKATALVTGLPFHFDEEAKQEVVTAAIPVLGKHDSPVMNWLGQYSEECLLIFALLGLLYSARVNLRTLQAEKLAETQKEATHDSDTVDESAQTPSRQSEL
ncbi:conserved hypothetical protein [Vibrio chagasii]|nr:conserved hypothetical protein [Vibrio chagasii]CAH7187952.1 conserved hypothetical protein [Vibrio chagasii]CAH7195482.1 conserved hypothetical protein [Vibrio chagasii]CAH7400071.1 conserved hypothetical protein [Vibrio chagasii]CAH7410087.1 conserved hypothetical protein [Vibrio chagasii]